MTGITETINEPIPKNNYVSGYGLPNCQMKGSLKTWINIHNESHSDGAGRHYHKFLITKVLDPNINNMVKIRLYHFDDLNDSYYTVENKSSKDYCLDAAYTYSDMKGMFMILISHD